MFLSQLEDIFGIRFRRDYNISHYSSPESIQIESLAFILQTRQSSYRTPNYLVTVDKSLSYTLNGQKLIEMECSVCLEHKQLGHFPQSPLTGNCSHRSSVCIECVTSFINSQVQDGATDQFICPECPEQLQYSTIQMFASGELFAL